MKEKSISRSAMQCMRNEHVISFYFQIVNFLCRTKCCSSIVLIVRDAKKLTLWLDGVSDP